jgi:hypothetical protein
MWTASHRDVDDLLARYRAAHLTRAANSFSEQTTAIIFGGLSTSMLDSVRIRKPSKLPSGRGRAPRQSARVARKQRQVTINFPSGALSSFLSGAFWFSSCTACGASTAASAAWSSKRFLGRMASTS